MRSLSAALSEKEKAAGRLSRLKPLGFKHSCHFFRGFLHSSLEPYIDPAVHHEDWSPYGLDKSPQAAADLFSVMSGNRITEEMIRENDYDEEVKDISAYMWVNENSVPTLCAYGVHDKVCPFDSVRHLIRALEENHVPFDYIEFPHSGHGLQNDNKLYVKYMEKLTEYLDKYLK